MTNTVYELDKFLNKDHVATPGFVVEKIYNLDIRSFNMICFPFNNYDSELKEKRFIWI